MRYTLSRLVATALAVITLSACDDIAEDERYIPVEGVTPARTVLIEDFTGQNCVNCPAAHAIIDRLVGQYGDKVIPVSIHAGGFGVSVENTRFPSYIGLMQPEGNAMCDRYGIDEWPKGVINGHGGPRNPDDWAAAVRDEIARESPVTIESRAKLDDETGHIGIETVIMPHADIEGTLKIWVTENGITAFQRDITLGRIPAYEHNHVYRASVNGLDGETVSLRANIHTRLNHSIAVRDNDKEKWDVRNLNIVTFISGADGVLQATSTKVSIE